ncbi:MAG TPA: hypothetical protein PLR94_15500 [Accumulibacter sp.]|uniref:hypothetical protein n=1 Tax=Accumulibacter sp. TaxID=2053492 RepID=UPI00287868C6|nr:hypothetical protein [Accumulibacter sp.]MDS4074567.1 hypothetical protein [Accumulibacter sp.]HMW18282.1 hypothetical protein [Accumulibacter sp.]HNK04753.1 hypothetical protein [Accumulibacter sp.]HNM75688.1 hypothetical protein [Accumulibacter sp.]
MSPEVKWTVVATVLAAVIAGVFAVVSKRMPEAKPEPTARSSTASIVSPQSGQSVGRKFTVTGTTAQLSDDRYLWLGVQIGQLVWPKEPRLRNEDKSWSQTVHEGGTPPSGAFTLVLFQVSADGDAYLTNWFTTGQRTGDWPGIEPKNLKGYAQLHVVSDLKLE